LSQARALQLLLIAVLLFGGVWPLTKHALADATPLWFGFSRAALAALSCTVLLLLFGRLRWPAPGDWPATLSLGLLQTGAFFAFTHAAIGLIPAGRTAILGNVTIFWLVPLSVWFLAERVSPQRWLAALVGLAGVMVMMGPWAIDWSAPGVLIGHAWLLGASLAWSIAIIIMRRRPPRAPLVELLPIAFVLASQLLFLVALWAEPEGFIGASSWPAAAFIGLIAAPIGTWAISEGTRHLNAVVASLGVLLVPLFGVALATLWLGEPLGWDMLAGGALIVASVWMAAKG
jgi:drug/metabolite transporter (DMT)-like permease